LNESTLKEEYDRDLNEVDGVDVSCECRFDAPGGVPTVLENDKQARADADSQKRLPERIQERYEREATANRRDTDYRDEHWDAANADDSDDAPCLHQSRGKRIEPPIPIRKDASDHK